MVKDRVIDRANRVYWKELQVAAVSGKIHDADNPAFILSMVKTPLLRRIAEGQIDLEALAACELEARA